MPLAAARLIGGLAACGLAAALAAEPARAQTAAAAAILEANRAATAGSGAPAALSVTFAFEGMGLKGQARSLTDLSDGRFADALDAGPLKQVQGFDGDHAWAQDASGAVTLQEGAAPAALARNEAYRRANLWWRPDRGGAVVEALGRRPDGDGECDLVGVTPRGGLRFEACFDAASHLLVRVSEVQGPQTIVTRYADYRPAGGRMVPWRVTVDDGEGPKYVQTMTVVSAAIAPAPAADAFAPPQSQLADFAIDGGATQTVIPFELINNHIYAEARVNGQGPFKFIFDTGGTELVTPALAKTLGLQVQGAFDAHGAGEGIMQAGFARVGELTIGQAHTKGEVFAVLPLDALSDIEGFDETGLVGFQTFRRFVVRIDYGARTLTLIDPRRFDAAGAGVAIPFTFSDHDVEIAGAFEGAPAKFRIDTGARDELTLNRPFAERIGLRRTHPKGVEAVDGWGLGGPSHGYSTRGGSLTLGPVAVTNFVASASTDAKGAFAGDDNQGNIGAGVLKRFVVTFDYGRQIMYLKPLAATPVDAGAFDRAGLWFNRAPDGFKVVDVTAHGPAEDAGVRPGDVIAAVDGAPAKDLAVAGLRLRLRTQPPGATVALKLLREGRPVDAKVVLRDQI